MNGQISRQAPEAVQGALQNVSGRHFVDDLSPPRARNVIGDERPGHDGGREPLIPEDDWQIGSGRQIARECTRRLCARTVAPFEIERQPEDDSGDFELGEDRRQRVGVGRERAARQRLQRAGETALDVGYRQADRLRAEVDRRSSALWRVGRGRGPRLRSGGSLSRAAITERRSSRPMGDRSPSEHSCNGAGLASPFASQISARYRGAPAFAGVFGSLGCLSISTPSAASRTSRASR